MKVIDKFIKNYLNGKPCIGPTSLIIEYRKYMDENKKLLKYHTYTFELYLIVTEATGTELFSTYAVLYDKDKHKAFSINLSKDSTVESLSIPMVIRFLIDNIHDVENNLESVYEENLDIVKYFIADIKDINIEDPLENWRFSVMKNSIIGLYQTHDIILSETMSDIEMNRSPDFRIVRSQLEDISLFRKY